MSFKNQLHSRLSGPAYRGVADIFSCKARACFKGKIFFLGRSTRIIKMISSNKKVFETTEDTERTEKR